VPSDHGHPLSYHETLVASAAGIMLAVLAMQFSNEKYAAIAVSIITN